MSAWSADIKIEQGATFNLGFFYYDPVMTPPGPGGDPPATVAIPITPDKTKPKDLTGCTARMQIKKGVKDATAAITATSEDPATVPAQGGRIVLGGDTGRIDIILTDADTDAIDFTKGVYDLEVEYPQKPGELRPFVERILEGAVTIDPNVTKVDT